MPSAAPILVDALSSADLTVRSAAAMLLKPLADRLPEGVTLNTPSGWLSASAISMHLNKVDWVEFADSRLIESVAAIDSALRSEESDDGTRQ